MSSSESTDTAAAEHLLADFLSRRAEGEAVDFDELCRQHPRIALRLRRLYVDWSVVSDQVNDVLPGPLDDASYFRGKGSARARAPDEPLVAAAEVRPGGVVGDFRLVRLLGRGGMGQVWEAEQISLGRRVALKLMRPDVSGERAVLRFEREARAAGRLTHPGIIAVYAAGTADGVHYIAQELVEDGFTLADHLRDVREGEALPPGHHRRIAAFFAQIADALGAAHAAGVVHRDVKPQNILVTGDDRPKVGDFGLARVVDDASLTENTRLVGTYYYMSPEQAQARSIEVDHRTDQFSLGAVLYEALTLKRPFEGDTGQQILERIRSEEPIDPRQVRSQVPADLAVVCRKMLEKKPADRYPTMGAIADELRRFLGNEPIHARPPGPVRRAHKWVARHPTLSAGLGLGAAALLVISALLADTAAARRGLLRLSDVKVVAQLEREAEALWPPLPAAIAPLDDWIARAGAVLSRAGRHEQTLAALRRRALPAGTTPVAAAMASAAGAAGAAGAEAAAGAPSPVFATPEDQWQHDVLAELVDDLHRLGAADGLLARVRTRRETAASIAWRSVESPEAARAWSAAIASIADRDACPLYGGLVVEPQLGLLPIGRDPRSTLWEFAHLLSGEVPERGADGELVVTERSCIVLVLLPGGRFTMGAQREDPTAPGYDPAARDNERPVTTRLDPFFIAKHELTQGQVLAVLDENPSLYRAGQTFYGTVVDLRHPVGFLSWDDTRQALERIALEIPTEAQWEYAARGLTTTPWYTGADAASLEGKVNLGDASLAVAVGVLDGAEVKVPQWKDGHVVHAPVGSFAPNPFGLHDVYGNVWEWCREPADYDATALRDGDGLRATAPNSDRIIRGGSFTSGPDALRSSLRNRIAGAAPDHNVGVRPSRPLTRSRPAAQPPSR